MAGSRETGLKAARTNKKKDPDFYKKIGAMGGRASNWGGFSADRELARRAGRKGGLKSRRKPKKDAIFD